MSYTFEEDQPQYQDSNLPDQSMGEEFEKKSKNPMEPNTCTRSQADRSSDSTNFSSNIVNQPMQEIVSEFLPNAAEFPEGSAQSESMNESEEREDDDASNEMITSAIHVPKFQQPIWEQLGKEMFCRYKLEQVLHYTFNVTELSLELVAMKKMDSYRYSIFFCLLQDFNNVLLSFFYYQDVHSLTLFSQTLSEKFSMMNSSNNLNQSASKKWVKRFGDCLSTLNLDFNYFLNAALQDVKVNQRYYNNCPLYFFQLSSYLQKYAELEREQNECLCQNCDIKTSQNLENSEDSYYLEREAMVSEDSEEDNEYSFLSSQ